MSGVPGNGGSIPPEEFDLGEIDETEADAGDPQDEGDEGSAADAEDGSGEVAEGEEADGEVERPAARGRRSHAQRLREQRDSLSREVEDLRRRDSERDARVRSLEQQQQNRVDPAMQAEMARRRQDHLSLLSPVEAAEFIANESKAEMRQYLQMQEQAATERFDKQSYDIEARSSRVHRDYRDRVEQLVAAERTRGNVVPRDIALTHLMGQDARKRAEDGAPKQRATAQARVNGNRTRPTGARSDGATQRGRADPNSYEAALARISGKPLF